MSALDQRFIRNFWFWQAASFDKVEYYSNLTQGWYRHQPMCSTVTTASMLTAEVIWAYFPLCITNFTSISIHVASFLLHLLPQFHHLYHSGHSGQLCTQHTITSHFFGSCPCFRKFLLSNSTSTFWSCHCPLAISRTATQSGNATCQRFTTNPSCGCQDAKRKHHSSLIGRRMRHPRYQQRIAIHRAVLHQRTPPPCFPPLAVRSSFSSSSAIRCNTSFHLVSIFSARAYFLNASITLPQRS